MPANYIYTHLFTNLIVHAYTIIYMCIYIYVFVLHVYRYMHLLFPLSLSFSLSLYIYVHLFVLLLLFISYMYTCLYLCDTYLHISIHIDTYMRHIHSAYCPLTFVRASQYWIWQRWRLAEPFRPTSKSSWPGRCPHPWIPCCHWQEHQE